MKYLYRGKRHSTIPDNYLLCLKKLNSLLRRLKQDNDMLRVYNQVIEDQLQRGIVEPVEIGTVGERIRYLPHHAVIRQDKETTKLRIVYDASSKTKGPSLNECLHAGPKLHRRMIDILIRFRLHKTAFVADIEKAFLNISVAEEDRDVLRFPWIQDCESDTDIREFRFSIWHYIEPIFT